MVRDLDAPGTGGVAGAGRRVRRLRAHRRRGHAAPLPGPLLDGRQSVEESRQEIRDTGFSRYPVTGDDVDDVLGFVHVRDMLLVEDPVRTRMSELVRPSSTSRYRPGALGAEPDARPRRSDRRWSWTNTAAPTGSSPSRTWPRVSWARSTTSSMRRPGPPSALDSILVLDGTFEGASILQEFEVSHRHLPAGHRRLRDRRRLPHGAVLGRIPEAGGTRSRSTAAPSRSPRSTSRVKTVRFIPGRLPRARSGPTRRLLRSEPAGPAPPRLASAAARAVP